MQRPLFIVSVKIFGAPEQAAGSGQAARTAAGRQQVPEAGASAMLVRQVRASEESM
jgi:hypothetical protein